jgi:hypothetical protein
VLIDILFPIGQQAPEGNDELRMPGGEIGALTRVAADVEEQELAAVDQQLPASGPDGVLLAARTRDAPEQPTVDDR